MDILHPFFGVCIHKLQNCQSMPMSEPGRSYLQATDGLGPIFFLCHMKSTQLFESKSSVIMLQMMNLMRMAISHCIFDVTQLGTSTMPQ